MISAPGQRLDSGDRVGRYEILFPLASGGQGEVWVGRLRAEHGFEKFFVLKFILPEAANGHAERAMFLDEARISSRISHPNVAQVLELGEIGGLLYMKDTENMTMRDVMVQHRASPTCAACHQIMDPMGFALENFNGAGKWIDDYRGQPLDVTGQMPTTGVPFNGPKELAQAIATDTRFPRCIASKLFTYATARAPDAFDDAQIDLLAEAFKQAQFSLPALVAKLVTSPAFTLRRAAP